MIEEKVRLCKRIEEKEEAYSDISRKIWEYAELGFHEYQSAQLLQNTLEAEGFQVETGLAGIPTAFKGTFGAGRPVVAFLGEFDALPGLSQKPGIDIQEKREGTDCGHGCGHNLLGTGSLAAAVAVKDYLKEREGTGTVIYFGCPGEEKGSGKTFMAREGCFEGLDAVFCWHPWDVNGLFASSSLADICATFIFHGKASHASASPHLGRSALDAVELMNVGCNFLREHVIPEARIHYAITNAGGNAANVVQETAAVYYEARAPRLCQSYEIFERISEVARGASIMTGTSFEIVRGDGFSDYIPNKVLGEVLMKNFQEAGAPDFDSEDHELAKNIQNTFSDQIMREAAAAVESQHGENAAAAMEGKVLADVVFPINPLKTLMPGSTDVGDVSYQAPTGQILTACKAFGTPGHSWQEVSQSGSSIGRKGMITAAKVMGMAAVDVFHDPQIIKDAKKEFTAAVKDGYHCPIPDEIKPDI